MTKIRYIPNRYDNVIHTGESNEELLLDCLKDFGYELEPKLNKAFMGKKVVVYVNNENIFPEEWADYEMSDGDVIEVTHTIEQGRRAGVIQIIVGIVLIAIGTVVPGAWSPYFYMAGIALIIGGILQIFFAPTEPQPPDQDTPAYGWDGPRTIWTAETSIPIVYGTHLVGGSGINFKIENVGSTSYASMLIALSEGEISGVMDEDNSEVLDNTALHGGKYGTQLVSNRTFDSNLDGWTVVQYWAWDASSGGQARATNWNDSSNAKMYQSIDITAGKKYRVQYTLRAVDDHDGQKYGKIRAELGGTAGAWQNVANIPDTSMNVVEVIEAGSSNSYIYFRADDYCNGAIDDIWVDEITNPYILINDQVITAYDDVTWWLRLGTNTQSTLTAFRDEVNTNYDYGGATGGRKLSKLFNQHTTTGNINKFVIHIEFPNGLFKINNKGDLKSRTVNVLVEFKKTGDSTWSRLTDTDANGDYYSTDANNGDWVRYEKKTTAKFLKTITVNNLDTDTYNIRIRRSNNASTDIDRSDRVDAVFVTEVLHADLAYPNTALLALKMKATNQLSGQLPNVQTLVQGKKIRVPDIQFSGSNFPFEDVYWDNASSQWKKISNNAVCTWDGTSYVTQYSSNPAYCLRDFITNDRYGLGEFITSSDLDDTTIDLAAKKQWQLVEGEHRNELHFVLEGPGEPAAVMQQIARVGRMLVFYSNGYIKFKYEEDESSVQLFTMGNVLENSFSLSFTPHTQLPNIMEVQYTDANDKYKMNTLEIVDETEWALGKPRRKKTLSLKGVTNVNQVLREAKFTLNKTKYVRMMAEWKAPLDAVHCEPGDVVDFQHDIVQWGWGGKAVGGSSTTIQLDQDVPANVLAAPTSYDIKVQHSDDTIETFDILSASDYTITIDGTFTTVPVEDDKYLIGQTGTTIYSFRIIGTSITDDEELQIQAVEHEAAVYSDTGLQMDTTEYSELPNPSIIPSNVTNLNLKETKDKLGFVISFNAPSQTRSDGTDEDTDRVTDYAWHRAEIYISVDNVNFDRIATAYEAVNNIQYTDVVPNGNYYVRVYSASRYVSSSTYEEANIKIKGDGVERPYPPSGLEIHGQGNVTTFVGKDIKFRWRPRHIYSGVGGIEIYDPTGGVDKWSYIKDFKVAIYDGETLLREEYVPGDSPSYIYTYEKNAEDNNWAGWISPEYRKSQGIPLGNRPVGVITIKVWQRNVANKLSAQPAVLTVHSDSPPKPANVTTTAEEDGVTVSWDAVNITDFEYYEYRTKIDSGSWSSWETITDTTLTRWLDNQELADQGSGRSTIYIDIRTVDVFLTTSPSASVSASCNNYKAQINVSPTPGLGHFTTIASAVDALPSTGGEIILKEGTHTLPSGGISLPAKNIVFSGVGKDSVIIRNAAASPGFVVNDKTNDYSFYNFTASSMNTATPFAPLLKTYGTYANNSPTVVISDINFKLIDKGIMYNASGDIGIVASEFSGVMTIDRCYFSGGRKCISAKNSDNITINNNIFEDNKWVCIEADTELAGGMVITNNTIRNFHFWGMDIGKPGADLGQGLSISGNHLEFQNTSSPVWGGVTGYYAPRGISVSAGPGDVSVTDNIVIMKNASPVNSPTKVFQLLYITSWQGGIISNNTMVASVDWAYELRGLYLNTVRSIANNNNIRILNNDQTDTSTGMYITNSDNSMISNNHITMTNSATDTGIRVLGIDDGVYGTGNITYNVGISVNQSSGNNVTASDM